MRKSMLLFLLVALCSCANILMPPVQTDPTERFEAARVLPSRGSANGDVEIVEYSSFACSHCKTTSDSLSKLLARDVGVTLIYKPMAFERDIKGKEAARASLAAAAQGKFWEMHDLLFKNQARLNEELYPELAEELGLDVARFNEDFYSEEIHQMVEANTREAVNVGVQGTPTTFFNGKPVLGGQSLSSLEASVRNARKK